MSDWTPVDWLAIGISTKVIFDYLLALAKTAARVIRNARRRDER